MKIPIYAHNLELWGYFLKIYTHHMTEDVDMLHASHKLWRRKLYITGN